jgi:hypothetical protein
MRALRVTRPIGTGHEAEADGAGPEQSGHDCLFMKGSARDYRRCPRRVLRMAAAAAWDARCASRTRAHAAVSFRAAPQPRALPRPRLTAAQPLGAPDRRPRGRAAHAPARPERGIPPPLSGLSDDAAPGYPARASDCRAERAPVPRSPARTVLGSAVPRGAPAPRSVSEIRR